LCKREEQDLGNGAGERLQYSYFCTTTLRWSMRLGHEERTAAGYSHRQMYRS